MPKQSTINDRACERCGKCSITRFCSTLCRIENLHEGNRRDEKERFWQHVNKQAGDGCWIWIGSLKKDGHGQFNSKHGIDGAHRVAWAWENGPIPEGMCVCHDCPGGDNKACVRPSHLYLGTRSENNRDAARKGTVPHGSLHFNAILDEDRVREIRRLHEGGIMQKEIAKLFGVSPTNLNNIVKRRTWNHVK